MDPVATLLALAQRTTAGPSRHSSAPIRVLQRERRLLRTTPVYWRVIVCRPLFLSLPRTSWEQGTSHVVICPVMARTRHIAPAYVLERIERLPDRILVRTIRPDRKDPRSSGLWYAVIRLEPNYPGEADFSTAARKERDAVRIAAAKIRDDLRGIGRYAPHWDAYDVEYRLLPLWEAAAKAARIRSKRRSSRRG